MAQPQSYGDEAEVSFNNEDTGNETSVVDSYQQSDNGLRALDDAVQILIEADDTGDENEILIATQDSKPVGPNAAVAGPQLAQSDESWIGQDDEASNTSIVDSYQQSDAPVLAGPPIVPSDESWIGQDDEASNVAIVDSYQQSDAAAPAAGPVQFFGDEAEQLDESTSEFFADHFGQTELDQVIHYGEEAELDPEDHTDDWIEESNPVGINATIPTIPLPQSDSAEIEAEDPTDDVWDDDGANVQRANVVLNYTLCLEDPWPHQESDDDTDDPPDDDGYNVQNTAGPTPPPPVVIITSTLPNSGAVPGWVPDRKRDVGGVETDPDGRQWVRDDRGNRLPWGPKRRPGQVFGEQDPRSPRSSARLEDRIKAAEPGAPQWSQATTTTRMDEPQPGKQLSRDEWAAVLAVLLALD